MKDLPQPRAPPHFPPVERFNAPTIVFLTVCTQNRKPILARADVHALLADVWRVAAGWRVGRYVLMHDHLHLFCAPARTEPLPLDRWVQFWKSRASRRWPRLPEQPVWQKSFWDTQLRSGESYEEKWEYVRLNPVRKGLVTRWEEWPFAGEIHVLDWSE
jgi:putative transposase